MNPKLFDKLPPRSSSQQAKSKLKILTLEPKEDGDIRVEAHFNPKEVQIDRTVPWQAHPSKDDSLGLEYTGGSARSMSIELLFDGVEDCRSVRAELDALQSLTENFGKGKAEKRPPLVTVVWGNSVEALPQFPAVVESLSVKCQMFSSDGKVLRATATVKLKEAGALGIKKAKYR